jgi:LysM repeat protein
MRRFIHLMLVLALLLPYGAVALAQELTPTPEGMEAESAMPASSIEVDTGPAAQATPDGQGGGATQMAQPQAGAGQGGGITQEGFGLGGYYPPPGFDPSAQTPGYIQHYVRYGENLFRISLRYGVPIYAIMAANPIIRNPNLIYAGTVLLIPTGGFPPPPPPPPPPGETIIHVVQRGEWLFLIARRYGTTVSAIVRANFIVNPNLIYPGQRLVIPVGTGPVPPPLTPIPPTPITPGPPPPQPGVFELGGHVFGYANAADMRNAGMTWAKVQIRWNQGESTASAQAAINEARAQGFKIMLSIAGNPEQIRANPQQYFQAFAQYLGQVAALGPDAIEVWNEQNIDREWPNGLISPQSYTQMLSAAYQAIKAANSSVMVISGAPAPTGFFGGACTGTGCDDAPFIQGMAANGAANFADCIGIHYNEGILPPTATSGDPRGNSTHYTRYYPAMVNLYASTFPSKPLCFTELGYLTPEGYPPLPEAFNWAQNTTVAQQSQWLAQATQLSRQSGRIRLLIVWNVNATEYGADPQAGYAIVRPGNICPACVALNAVMQ